MQLCQSEWTVLQSLWERQPQTLMQLVEDLKVRAGWSASTSKTMAARMSEKGLLRYEGKPRRYYPNVTREEAGFEETEQLLYALTHEPPTAPAAYNIESLQLD